MNNRVLVTGSSSGIGLFIAEKFISSGYEVIINGGHDRDRLLYESKRLNTKSFFCDVSNTEKTTEMFSKIEAEFGGIDILVNSAGISHIGLFSDMTYGEIKNILDTNLYGMINCCHLAVPYMVRQKWGRIINISSIWGNVGASCEAVYSASKGGVNSFSKALGKELAPSEITVNAVACGVIDTKMNSSLSDCEMDNLKAQIPAGRLGTPKEVAELCFFLASPAAAYLNAQVITIDGGFL